MPWFPAKTRAQQTAPRPLTTEILSFTKLSGQKVTELHGPALVLSRLVVNLNTGKQITQKEGLAGSHHICE